MKALSSQGMMGWSSCFRSNYISVYKKKLSTMRPAKGFDMLSRNVAKFSMTGVRRAWHDKDRSGPAPLLSAGTGAAHLLILAKLSFAPVFSKQPLLQGHSSEHKSLCCSRHVLGLQQHASGKGWVWHDVPRRWASTSRKGNLAIEREEPGFQNVFTGPMLFQLESVEKKKKKQT